MNEFTLIDAFISQFTVKAAPFGPGDDCALIPQQGVSCITTDAVVERVHFTRATFSMKNVGHKALAVNLSDLAAMGATPQWFTVALGLPAWVGLREVKQLGAGMSALAHAHGAQLVGGNITDADQLSLTLTVSGAMTGAPMLRSGAHEGDSLYVSGPLGDAAAGLQVLTWGRGPRSLASAQRRPAPHVAFGQWVKDYAHAAIDVSDGLAQDLAHLCRASQLGANLESRAIPLSEALLQFAGSREQALPFALRGGEDYVLLVTVPDGPVFEAAATRAGFFVQRVGTMIPGAGVTLDGRPLRGRLGFAHHANRALQV